MESLGSWFTRKDWKSLKEQVKEFKMLLADVGNAGGRLEDQNAGGHVEREGHVDEISDGSEDSIGNWMKGHSCYTMARKLSSCPETF